MSELLTSESVSNPELFTLHASAVAHERQGEATEAAFMAKAFNLGFAVAKPWGRERYNFILDSGHYFWKIGGQPPISSQLIPASNFFHV
jgi:hypothetical protein